MACTPFYYAAEPDTIVALFPDAEGVRLRADQQFPDNSWRTLSELRFCWDEFTQFAHCAGQIAAAPQAAMAQMIDAETGRPVHREVST